MTACGIDLKRTQQETEINASMFALKDCVHSEGVRNLHGDFRLILTCAVAASIIN